MGRLDLPYRKRLQEELKRCEEKLKSQMDEKRRMVQQEHITYLKFHLKRGVPKGVENSIPLTFEVV